LSTRLGRTRNRSAAALTQTRRVDAIAYDRVASHMQWRTTRADAEAVAEQAVRQLELGYERIQSHNATFPGFSEPPEAERR